MNNMNFVVIYDGRCNLCSTLVQGLEQVDRGQRFRFVPMQDVATLAQWGVTPTDCEQGMIVINVANPRQRWQGSDAAEEIGRQLPAVRPLIEAYRAIPGLKGMGDRVYSQVRDHRYDWFGSREQVYESSFPVSDAACETCTQRKT